jgi:hypothetical protein
VARVHDFVASLNEDSTKGYSLLVTKYSFLASTFPFDRHDPLGEDRLSDRELLLHFDDFDTMGTRADAELIEIRAVVHAELLKSRPGHEATDVRHVHLNPQGVYPRELQRAKLTDFDETGSWTSFSADLQSVVYQTGVRLTLSPLEMTFFPNKITVRPKYITKPSSLLFLILRQTF